MTSYIFPIYDIIYLFIYFYLFSSVFFMSRDMQFSWRKCLVKVNYCNITLAIQRCCDTPLLVQCKFSHKFFFFSFIFHLLFHPLCLSFCHLFSLCPQSYLNRRWNGIKMKVMSSQLPVLKTKKIYEFTSIFFFHYFP